MSVELLDCTLGNFVRLQRGHDLTASEQRPGSVPVMGSAGPNGTHSEAKAKGPGVVIGRSGASMGRVHFSEIDYWPHNTCLYVTDFLGNNPRFAYYLIQTLDLAAFNSGSAQPSLNRNFIYSIPLRVPARHEQDCIVELLCSLDDRIALLRETNATLEAIAQSLFKSWFVDFDPVRAKMEDRAPEGMDEATAALFPDSFEESALGLVPKGWRVMPIGDAVDAVGGATPDTKNPAYWEPAVHCWTTPKDLSGIAAPVLLDTERKLSDQGLAKIGSGLLPVGTLLLSSRAPIGYLALTQVPLAINQGYIAMPPGGLLPPLYMLFWCRQNMENIKGRANGSTFMEISKKAFRPIPALVPSPEIIQAFTEIAGRLFDRLIENEKQAQTLATLRDTLLPRLISGQLRLPEAEALLEAFAA
jgi:type I restriction enzyme S subunit